MTDSATIRFLPWMRRGVSRLISGAADELGWPLAADAATIRATVTVAGTDVTRDLHVRGPGDVVGIAPGQVVREDPPAGTQDAEANYFAAVELVSPDLPWMFSPASPNASNGRLAPWMALVVVATREGVTIESRPDAPLRILSIDDARMELPDLGEAWAWVHVQASTNLTMGVEETFVARPEAFVARLVCPRRLVRDQGYTACLVPTFESGRRAGLGLAVDTDDVSRAWTPTTVAIELPVYHSWTFRTSRQPGDFETLARRLNARTLPPTVGIHDLDIGDPGSARLPRAPGTLVSFEGGLLAPAVETRPWKDPHRERFQTGLRTLLDEALVAGPGAGAPGTGYRPLVDDPVVAPAAYGALPATATSIPAPGAPIGDKAPRWLSESNLDPVQRSAAGLGVEVVRRDQESLLATAWDQAAGLGAVNRVLNRSRLAAEVGRVSRARLDTLAPSSLLQVTAGAHARLKGEGMSVTVWGRLRQSVIPDGLVSGAFRRQVRPGTTISRSVQAGPTQPSRAPRELASSITSRFITDPVGSLDYASFVVPARLTYSDTEAVSTWTARPITIDRITQVLEQPVIARPVEATVRTRPITTARGGRTSMPRPRLSAEATRATGDPVRTLVDRSVTAGGIVDMGGPTAVPVEDLSAKVAATLDPVAAVAARVRSIITAPATAWGDQPVPASMEVSPEFPEPLYERLVRIDPELLMPGVSSVPRDTVALASVNPAFVEAFLLGANHELAREFLWREYPTDLTGTWLRTFWDSVEGDVENIPAVAAWRPGALGTHQVGMDPAAVLVLLIRSDLLRRYPGTLIYAVAARWQDREQTDGPAGSGARISGPTPDDTSAKERVEDPDATPEWPIFVGRLGRDITFLGFGFDVDVERDVKGSTRPADQRPGWYFVLEQPPTEPRFGLDKGGPGQAGGIPRLWTNASWHHQVDEGGGITDVTHARALGRLAGTRRAYDDDGENTWKESWGEDSAAMARITLQRPVRMLIHADQMLESEGTD